MFSYSFVIYRDLHAFFHKQKTPEPIDLQEPAKLQPRVSLGLILYPIIFARNSFKEGSFERISMSFALKTLPSKAPPITLNFSLLFANFIVTFAAATGSFEYASAVGPERKLFKPSLSVPATANRANVFLALCTAHPLHAFDASDQRLLPQ